VLRYSLPVFVLPPGPAVEADLAWVLAEVDGAIAVKVANGGRKHAQVADVVLVATDGTRTTLATGLLGYALPGASRTWTTAVPWSAAAREGTLEVRINGQEARATLPAAGSSR
jgi:fimbrial chaperone protein